MRAVWKIVLGGVYFYYHVSGVVDKKVLIKSIRSEVLYNGISLPQREFYALSKSHKKMAWGNVMVGRFQEYKYQYCIFSGTFVKNLYRRRHLAEKLVKARIIFCEKEKFENVIVPFQSVNLALLKLLQKCGFTILKKEEWVQWMKKEASLFKNDMLIAHYIIKKPVL